VAYINDQFTIKRILDHVGLSPPAAAAADVTAPGRRQMASLKRRGARRSRFGFSFPQVHASMLHGASIPPQLRF